LNSENNVWKSNRNIILSDDINSKSVSSVISSIFQFNEEDKEKLQDKKSPVKLWINSSGGYAYDALALIDIIQKSKTPIHTYIVGKGMSAGLYIFASGHKRYVGENAFTLIHTSKGGGYGTVPDLEIVLAHRKDVDRRLDELLVSRTKITQDQIDDNRNSKTEWYLNANQCLEYGIADELFSEI